VAFAYVLIAIVKKEIQLDVSLYTLPQKLSVSVFYEDRAKACLSEGSRQKHDHRKLQTVAIIRSLTGQ
jgi:hypothetical protein